LFVFFKIIIAIIIDIKTKQTTIQIIKITRKEFEFVDELFEIKFYNLKRWVRGERGGVNKITFFEKKIY